MAMTRIEARVSRSWAIRMGIAGVAFLAFGAMSVYDGKVRYPAVNQDFRDYLANYVGSEPDQLRKVYGPDDELSQFSGFCERWNEYWKANPERQTWLARRGWKDMDQSKLLLRERTPGGVPIKTVLVDYIYSNWDLRTQLLMAAGCLPVGLIILVRLLRALPKTLAADDTTLYATNGRQIPFAAIRDIDKRKWDRKAIAVVHYELDGKRGKAVIDDWIFKDAGLVLERIETTLAPPPPAEEAPTSNPG